MIGALIGDIVGSRYERVSHKSKGFKLFDRICRPTDDSVMSLVIAKAILESEDGFRDLSRKAIGAMQELGRIYKNAGYGGTFFEWIWAEDPQPYNSFGNGSAMRVGPCGFAAENLEEAKALSAAVTLVSHDHPEGMKGAEAIAVAVFLARSRKSKRIVSSYNAEEIIKAKKQHRDPLIIPDFSCHHLRHTFCTRLCEAEMNMKILQSVMGHSNIQTTMDIYAEATNEKKTESFKDLTTKYKLF